MRNLKKVLALVLVFAMMLSTCVVASAASFPDVEASYQYGEAIDLLASLNILGGYEDGTFKPENNITRAEFAKVVYVVFNGMDDVNAQMYVSDSQFNDVAKNQWFNGHVNWASENSIVGGYGDGTFLPSNNVAVKEAIKMVVTAVTDKALTYPNGYIQEARALKLLDDVTISSIDAPATRGQVAQLAYNLLKTPSRLCLIDLGELDKYGNEQYKKNAPLEFVFGLTAKEGVTLDATYENDFTGVASNVLEGQVQISYPVYDNDGKQTGTTSITKDYAGNADDLFGQLLKAYFNSDNELVALVSVSDVIEETTANQLVGNGTVDHPYVKTMGKLITYLDGSVQKRDYGVKNVWIQNGTTGAYALSSAAKKTATDGSGEYYLLKDFYAPEYWNSSAKVTLIDYPDAEGVLDGVVDTVVIDFQGSAQVTRYLTATKQIRFGSVSASFDKAIGHEAFADADYTDITKNPTYATYTVKKGVDGVVYTLAPTTSVEGVLTSVDTANDKVVVGGTTYAAFGKNSSVFNALTGGIGNTVKLFLDANGFVVGQVVTESESVYDLNIGKVIAAADEADAWGNNIKATLTVVTPDGTEKVLTIDTTVNTKVGDTIACDFAGTTAPTWLKSGTSADDAKELYFNYTKDSDTSDGDDSNYDIVGNYIHYEVDSDTNEVVKIAALDDISTSVQPSNSTKTWSIQKFAEASNALCYKSDLGFYTASDAKGETVTGTLGYPADGFVGMYYEENADGELETAYYTASNIPAFANKGDYTLVWADDELVAMVVTKSAEAVNADKVLGIVTGFATVPGESEKNGKPTYRIEITMLVDGESQNFYTEDFLTTDLPDTTWTDLATTANGIVTNQLAYLQLMSDGKVEVDMISNKNYIDIDYIEYSDLTFAIATAVRGSYVTAQNVLTDWENSEIQGWGLDPVTGEMKYFDTAKPGVVNPTGSETLLRVCNETKFITISGTPNNLPVNADIFQQTTASKLTAGGEIMKSDAVTYTNYIFGYEVFAVGEAEDTDNDGALKVVFVFDTPIDTTPLA